jgi:hypothetical protein
VFCPEFIDRVKERIAKREIVPFYKEDTLLGIGIAEISKLAWRLCKYLHVYKCTVQPTRNRAHNYLKEWCYNNNLF